jgi:hypothetical protein
MTTREEMKNEIHYLLLAYPNFAPILEGKPNTVDLFMDILGEYEDEMIHKSIIACIKEPGRKFAPLPGELLERVRGFIATEKNKYVPPKEEKWADLSNVYVRKEKE